MTWSSVSANFLVRRVVPLLSFVLMITADAVAATSAPCDIPNVTFTAADPGATNVTILSPCRKGEDVSVDYAGATSIVELDQDGKAMLVVDAFAGARDVIRLRFLDRTEVMRVPSGDFTRVTKVALVWTAGVDLDLHAFAPGAWFGDPGHVWAGATEAAAVGDGRGRGTLTSAARGDGLGNNVEVYTYQHVAGEPAGVIRLAVDFASRGDRAEGAYCGDGRFARVRFRVIVFDRGRIVRNAESEFSAIPCGIAIAPAARYSTKLIPDIRVGTP